MKHDFRQEQAGDLIPDGWYEAVVVQCKTDVTRSGMERWRLKLEIASVLDSKQMEIALGKVGAQIEDVLIDSDKDFWRKKVRGFMKSAFPEHEDAAKEAEEGYEAPELTGDDAIGRTVGVQISINDGNAEYDEPSKVNRCWRYKPIGVPANKPNEPKSTDEIM